MSTAGADVMVRSSSFVGTLKRLFKGSHRSEGGDGAGTGAASVPGDALCKLPQFTAALSERNSLDSQLSQSLAGSGASSPFSARKSVDRQFFESNSGSLMSTSLRSASTAQVSPRPNIGCRQWRLIFCTAVGSCTDVVITHYLRLLRTQ